MEKIKIRQALKEIEKLRELLPGYCAIQFIEVNGDVKFIHFNAKFQIDEGDGRKIPIECLGEFIK